jgi:cytochrome c-type biogenesis protein CcmH/NrfG
MKPIRSAIPFLLLLGLLFCGGTAWPQGIQRPGPALVQIRGQVRYPSGAAARQGIMITIEDAAGGSVVAQLQTDSRGTFLINSIQRAVYTVTAHQPGYQDDSQRVELTTVPTAYVELTLVPLPGKAPPAGGPAPSQPTVSAAELALPAATRREFEKARQLVEQEHHPKQAIPHLREVVKKAPSFAEAYLLLGTAQMDLHHWNDAQTALEQAISLDDKASSAFLALGACYNEELKFSQAEKPLLQGLKLAPQSAMGHYELARAYWSQNRWQDAAPHAQKAVQLDPTLAPAYVVLGNVMLRERNAPGALKDFKEYLRLEPNGAMAASVADMVSKIEKALGSSK